MPVPAVLDEGRFMPRAGFIPTASSARSLSERSASAMRILSCRSLDDGGSHGGGMTPSNEEAWSAASSWMPALR
jgi:hypothetical protein